jgi:hypothetical protein
MKSSIRKHSWAAPETSPQKSRNEIKYFIFIFSNRLKPVPRNEETTQTKNLKPVPRLARRPSNIPRPAFLHLLELLVYQRLFCFGPFLRLLCLCQTGVNRSL